MRIFKSKNIFMIGVVVLGSLLAGCTHQPTAQNAPGPTPDQAQKGSPAPGIVISDETTNYTDPTFYFSFSYPKSLTFEPQSPYPGGTIKPLSLRVDGLTESTLLNNDLPKSLMANDLYCNLDESYGEATCTNKSVEPMTTLSGVQGFKIMREKQLYTEDSDAPTTYEDVVYAFPLLSGAKAAAYSPYKAIVFSVKLPSQQNLDILKQIVETLKVD